MDSMELFYARMEYIEFSNSLMLQSFENLSGWSWTEEMFS